MSEDGNGFLYAELLANIRQVLVVAALPTPPKQDETRVNITNDGQRLFLDDCTGFTTTILLPARISDSHKNQAVPWAAPDLETGSAVKCERCRSTIIPDGKLKVWKDLPSENWAEMMDSWSSGPVAHPTPGESEMNMDLVKPPMPPQMQAELASLSHQHRQAEAEQHDDMIYAPSATKPASA
ncbi:hypothetical protein E4U45_007158 [Claviceps purpurea]|nr:hypothetical protein E4U45_007158 [Claviceps purpurea]